MKILKQWLPDILVVILFAVLSYAYFFPAATEGRILYRHDASAGRGAGQEQTEYLEKTGERTRWTNSLFGGMPTYQLAPSYDSQDTLISISWLYRLGLPENVWYVFIYLLGFYILLRAFDFRQHLAALGSIIWAFSSYFFIIIAAGHIWKVIALAYLPPMIAGVVLAYKGKYLWGLVVTAIFAALEIFANHVQMTYYYLFIILFMVIAYLVDAIRNKKMAHFAKATAVCAVGALIGICLNLSNLYHTWQYSKESMRGKSELVKADTGNQTSSGLDRDYITQWSYGIDETWTLLIPNAKGGAHQIKLGEDADAMAKVDPQFQQIVAQWYQYWGEQPFTAGPVYVGAFVMMLFILGCFIVKGPMKWALLAATILSVLLSWGKYFMPLTDFFIDYVPMYAKFRTVSSILVIAEFTIPLLGMLALKELVERPQLIKERMKDFLISFGLTGGLALLFALAPRVFFSSYVSTMEMHALQGIPADQLVPLLANLEEVRMSMFTADAWRSFFIILIGVALLWSYSAGKLKPVTLVGSLIVLCLVDMWDVNKRYLYDGQFVEKIEQTKTFEPTETDKLILQDKDLNYRVLNLASNTFNENNTSYWHKSIGGYHAAKLRRYQEMIEEHISAEMNTVFQEVANAGGDMDSVDATKFPVLNMLNARYFIFPLEAGQTVPLRNPFALGNGWFVNQVTYVDNANEEIAAIHGINPIETVVVDKRFESVLKPAAESDSTCSVVLTAYEPNDLKYEVNSAKGGTVVFSEIYYPGWQAYIDGEKVEHGRANYILRAMNVPAGKHVVEFKFDPDSLHATETIAYIAFVLLAIAAVVIVVISYRQNGKQTKGGA